MEALLNLKTIEDINNYYINKGIKPYWSLYENKYLLQLHHVIEITKIFDELISLYPNVLLNGIGDLYKYEKYLYKDYKYKDYKYKNDPYIRKPTHDKDMIGNHYNFMVGGRYSEENKILIINHNSLMVMSDNIKNICGTLVHEFYREHYGLEDFSDRQLKELCARELTKSYLDRTGFGENGIIRIIKEIIFKL